MSEVCTCGCGGTGRFREKELSESSLTYLKKYEKELQNELSIVRKKIKEIVSEEE